MNANVITQNGPDSGDIQYESLCILHFNDCYNVEPCDKEPVGGAARFVNALHQFDHLDPLILFSGDIIAPSISMYFFFKYFIRLLGLQVGDVIFQTPKWQYVIFGPSSI